MDDRNTDIVYAIYVDSNSESTNLKGEERNLLDEKEEIPLFDPSHHINLGHACL